MAAARCHLAPSQDPTPSTTAAVTWSFEACPLVQRTMHVIIGVRRLTTTLARQRPMHMFLMHKPEFQNPLVF